jgi:hypothetical protein
LFPCNIKRKAGRRIRTDDLLITNQLLYQLSYAGIFTMGNLPCERFLRRFSRCYSTVGLVTQRTPTKTSEKTWLQNLLRHKSASYYARAFANGKEVWKSLNRSWRDLEQQGVAAKNRARCS